MLRGLGAAPFKRRLDDVTAKIDDLEYALQGLGASAVGVLRQCVLDAASICSDTSMRAALLRSHGVLPRIVAAMSSASCSADPIYSLAIGGLLHALANHGPLLDDDKLAGRLAQALLCRLEVCTAPSGIGKAKALPPPPPLELDAAWSYAQLLCPEATASLSRPSSVGDIMAIVQRLCVLGLAECVRASSAACRPIREHTGLHALPLLIQRRSSHAPRAALHVPFEEEVEASLEILEVASFPAEDCAEHAAQGFASDASGKASCACEPGGRPLDLLPVIKVATRSARQLYSPAWASPSTSPMLRSQSCSAGGSGSSRSLKRNAAVSFEERRAKHRYGFRNPDSPQPCAAPAVSPDARKPPSSATANSSGGSSGISSSGGRGGSQRKQPRNASADVFNFSSAQPAEPSVAPPRVRGKGPPSWQAAMEKVAAAQAAEGREDAAGSIAGAANEVAAASDSKTSHAQAVLEAQVGHEVDMSGEREAEEEEAPRRMLGRALRTLVNLTHGSIRGCEACLEHGLALAACVLSAELEGADTRGGLAHHFDTALMAIGMLTNCLELCTSAAETVGSQLCLPTTVKTSTSSQRSGGVPLIMMLSTTLRALLSPQPAAPQPAAVARADGSSSSSYDIFAEGGGGGEECDTDKLAMEREVSAAYTSLLVGFLCRQHPPHAALALRTLEEESFVRVSKLLQSFLELQSEANLISGESAATMSAIIDWMSG